MNRLATIRRHLLEIILFVAASLASDAVIAGTEQLQNDGWYSWRITAAENTADWCCYVWGSGEAQKDVCNLDSKHSNYSSFDDERVNAGEMQIYVQLRDGDVEKIRTLSPNCPIKTRSKINELGTLAVAESIAWLQASISPHSDLSTDAIAAISVHAGEESVDVLVDTAQHDPSLENRKDSVFWMAQVRVSDTSDVIEDLMNDDANSDMREHAAFSYSVSGDARAPEALIRQGKRDKDPDVRSQAWFWLAQSGSSESESAIRNAVKNDKNSDVREQAIFALSQLPDERAYAALIDVIEDQSLPADDRKQAVFWLAQTGSDEALAYFDELFAEQH